MSTLGNLIFASVWLFLLGLGIGVAWGNALLIVLIGFLWMVGTIGLRNE